VVGGCLRLLAALVGTESGLPKYHTGLEGCIFFGSSSSPRLLPPGTWTGTGVHKITLLLKLPCQLNQCGVRDLRIYITVLW
jgi:hypothetical protein